MIKPLFKFHLSCLDDKFHEIQKIESSNRKKTWSPEILGIFSD